MSIRLRPVLALALCAGLVGGLGLTSASAAPKPVCNLVTDPKGDAGGPTGANNDAAMDIVSADIATNAKKVTAVIRVQKLAATSTNYPQGLSWRLNFSVGDAKYFISAISDRDGVVGQSGYTDPTSGQGTIAGAAIATLDEKKNEVRITSSSTAFAGQINLKVGTVISELGAVTGAIAQVPGVGNLRYPTLDTTTGGEDYKGGTASCVVVGK